MNSIFEHSFVDTTNEIFETLIEKPNMLVERIISNGQSTPEGEWLCQMRDEYVLLLKGSAGLSFRAEERYVELKPGDWLVIPSNTDHRVDFTSSKEETIWFAVHYE